jgi:hypothetical protein
LVHVEPRPKVHPRGREKKRKKNSPEARTILWEIELGLPEQDDVRCNPDCESQTTCEENCRSRVDPIAEEGEEKQKEEYKNVTDESPSGFVQPFLLPSGSSLILLFAGDLSFDLDKIYPIRRLSISP